ncbi:MAG: amidase [Solimonas sp.]
MRVDEYAGYDALGLMALLAKKQVSADDLQRCALEAIDRLQPQLNFMAGAIDREAPWQAGGPFSGLPFLLKEGHGLVGGALTLGTRLSGTLRATQDSELTRRFRRAGVRILGETTTPEFGSSPVTESNRHGVTRNPWHLDHSSGGSSGGSSAAVAAGVVPVAQSSDGGGSIRLPAHCCGLYGLKPTRWRTPEPMRSLFNFSHFHVATRTVRDSAAFLDVQHGHAPGTPALLQAPERPYLEETARTPKRLRIGVMRRSPGPVPVSAGCTAALDRAVRLAESLGHIVEDAEPAIAWPALFESFIAAWFHALPLRIGQLAALSGLAPGPDTLDAMTLKCMAHAQQFKVDDVAIADSRFFAARVAVDQFFTRYDLWLTPTGVTQAPRIGQFDPRRDDEEAVPFVMRVMNEFVMFTPLLNITGHPAASIPLHQAGGLPAGVQLVGPIGDEATILRLSAQFEAADPWIARRPPHSVFAEP